MNQSCGNLIKCRWGNNQLKWDKFISSIHDTSLNNSLKTHVCNYPTHFMPHPNIAKTTHVCRKLETIWQLLKKEARHQFSKPH